MKKKKIELIVLTSFNSLGVIYSQYNFFFSKMKKHIDISLINISNLGLFNSKNQKFDDNKSLKFEKKNPKNLAELKKIIQSKKKIGKKLIFLDNIPRRYDFFFFFFILKRFNALNIVLANIGNIQPPSYYYKINIVNFLNIFFFRKLPRYFYYIFSVLKIFPKVDILFLSNKKLFNILKRKENNFFSRIKKVILVNSFENTKIEKLTNKYILLIEKDLKYLIKYKKYKIKLNENEYSDHFDKNYKLINKLSKYYNKKPIVSIHPNYDYNFINKRFKKIKVVKGNAKKLINESFFILFFDSSAIIDAISRNKKIINLKSEIFERKKFKTDIYNNHLNILTISNAEKNIDFRQIDNYLNKKNNYSKFFKTYINPIKNKFDSKRFLNYLIKNQEIR